MKRINFPLTLAVLGAILAVIGAIGQRREKDAEEEKAKVSEAKATRFNEELKSNQRRTILELQTTKDLALKLIVAEEESKKLNEEIRQLNKEVKDKANKIIDANNETIKNLVNDEYAFATPWPYKGERKLKYENDSNFPIFISGGYIIDYDRMLLCLNAYEPNFISVTRSCFESCLIRIESMRLEPGEVIEFNYIIKSDYSPKRLLLVLNYRRKRILQYIFLQYRKNDNLMGDDAFFSQLYEIDDRNRKYHFLKSLTDDSRALKHLSENFQLGTWINVDPTADLSE